MWSPKQMASKKKSRVQLPNEEKEYDIQEDGTHISRKQTTAEHEVIIRKEAAHAFIAHLPESCPEVDPYIPNFLENAIFCGHLVTDLDSIAGAIGAAELYGGIPARASEVNSETAFALKLWDMPVPRPIEELLVELPDCGVCLVDHQQVSQLNKAIDVDRIVGVIDHHALQNATIVTDKPIYIDIRPWGSMSTIIAHTFLTLRKRPSRKIAGMLLCAILSDTLNLQGPTTTEYDRVVVAALVEIAGVEDIQYLATQQFKAKSSELGTMTAEALCTGDQKVFSFKTERFTGSIGFAVVETVDDEVIVSRAGELLVELANDKEAQGFALSYLAVVNIVLLRTTLLLIGPAEASLAKEAFHSATPLGEVETGEAPQMLSMGSLVSRKKDFIPAITRAIKQGWALPSV